MDVIHLTGVRQNNYFLEDIFDDKYTPDTDIQVITAWHISFKPSLKINSQSANFNLKIHHELKDNGR